MKIGYERCGWIVGILMWATAGVYIGISIASKPINPVRDCRPRMIKMYTNNLVEIICMEPNDEPESKR